MAKIKDRTEREPKPDSRDSGPQEFYILYDVSGYWRVYIDDQGEQAFSRRRALQLRDYLLRSRPKGFEEVRVAQVLDE